MTASVAPAAGEAFADAMTVDEFEARFADREESWELVEGVPVMPPFESMPNTSVAGGLVVLLYPYLGSTHLLAPHAGLHLPTTGRGPTIRVPDLVVAARRSGPRIRGDVTGVALVAEVVSDSSVTTDLVVKRREYAEAGIPAYLVVDARTAPPRLWLFENPGPDGYPDPAGDGTTATLTIGEATITLTSADLDDFL